MIAYQHNCLDPQRLDDLLAGRMGDEQFQSALEHIESCSACKGKAEASTNGSVESPLYRLGSHRHFEDSSYSQEPQCVAAIQEVIRRYVAPSEVKSSSPLAGIERLGSYRILSLLGVGGMGCVYKAQHERLKRKVAIKILASEKHARPGWLERFNREMTSIAALEHPQVVRALDAGDDQDLHYLVMELLDGLDLGKIARRVEEFSIATACEITRQSALGLQAIHDSGLVHRDVKPSNLFVTRDGKVKILDLGLVLDGESPVEGDERLTTVGHLMGTIPYMSREQMSDSSQVDARADLYSLGATLFRLLAGKTPHAGSNLASTIQSIQTQPCPSLRQLRNGMPESLVNLVDSLLTHSPQDRPQSASEVALALSDFCEGHDLPGLLWTAESLREDCVQHSSVLLPMKAAASEPVGPVRKWIGMAMLPLALLSGILLMLSTDRGKLIIKSDRDDIEVVVRNSGKEVDRMTVSTDSESTINLWSGKYEIEISGQASDELVISQSQVTILRGADEIVQIYEEFSKPSHANSGSRAVVPASQLGRDSGESIEELTQSFQGKGFNHWLAVLVSERDSSTIATAMEAVTALASTPEEELEAASQMLRPARRLGGLRLEERHGDSSAGGARYSRWFMADLLNWFPKLSRQAQSQAIREELSEGNDKSWKACLFILERISQQELHEAFSEGKFASWTIARLRAKIEDWEAQFSQLPTQANEAQDLSIALALAYNARIRLAQIHPPMRLQDDPQMVAWAKRQLTQEGERLKEWQNTLRLESRPNRVLQNPVSLSDVSAMAVWNALQGQASSQNMRPVIVKLFNSKAEGEEQANLISTLERIREEEPIQFAEAAAIELIWIRVSANANNVFGLPSNRAVFPIMIRSLLDHPDPMVPIQAITQVHVSRVPLAAEFPPQLLIEVLPKLLERLVLETASSDPVRVAKLAFGARGLCFIERFSPEVFEVLLTEATQRSEDDGLPGIDHVSYPYWPSEVDLEWPPVQEMQSGQRSVWNHSTLSSYVILLITGKPEVSLPWLLDRMKDSDLRERLMLCNLLLPLLHVLPNEDHEEGTTVKERAIKRFVAYLTSEPGKTVLQRLDRQLNLDADREWATSEVLLSTDLLLNGQSPLDRQMQASIAISVFRGTAFQPAAVRWVRNKVQAVSELPLQPNFPIESHATLLNALEQLPFDVVSPEVRLAFLLRLAWSNKLSFVTPKLAEEIYTYDKAKFVEFFREQILSGDAEQFQGANQIQFERIRAEHAWGIILSLLARESNLPKEITEFLSELSFRASLESGTYNVVNRLIEVTTDNEN